MRKVLVLVIESKVLVLVFGIQNVVNISINLTDVVSLAMPTVANPISTKTQSRKRSEFLDVGDGAAADDNLLK